MPVIRPPSARTTTPLLLLLLNSVCALSGCGTIPNAFALIRASRFYKQAPQFVATRGPVSTAEGKDIIARLERQTGKTDILTRHLAFEQTISDSPLILGNRVTLLENARAAYPAMLEAIGAARHNINLETFIFSDDTVGREFVGALIAKRRQGVEVNIIYDSFGSYDTPDSFFGLLRANGIRVLQFDPISPWSARFTGLRTIETIESFS